MTVKEHTAYKKARDLAKLIWIITRSWDKVTNHILGNQFIRSVDSISANLAEGWNRYTKKDKINFYIIARGSANESIDWLEKAYERNLINLTDYQQAKKLLCSLPKEINGLIKGTKSNLKA